MRVLLPFIIASCFLTLNACVAPVSKDQLRQHAIHKVDFEVNRSYQQVFTALLTQTRKCYLDKEQKRQITVVGNRDNGLKTANITIEEVYAMAEHDAYMVIDITYQNENLSTVSAYGSRRNSSEEIMSIKSWAMNENDTCKVNWLI